MPTKQKQRLNKLTTYARSGKKTQDTRAKGVPGLTVSAGRVAESYLTIMSTLPKRVKLWKEMRDHPTIGTLLDACMLPVFKAGITVEVAAGNTPGDQAATEWLQGNIDSMHRQTWRSHYEDALECFWMGFYVGEIILEKRGDGRMWLKNISPRAPETIEKWTWDDEGVATEVYQRRPDTKTVVPIPLSECVHIAFRGRKGNPEGESILKSLYRPWYFVKNLENTEAIGIERDVGGTPVAEIQEGVSVDSGNLDKLENALKDLRNDETSYIITPPGVKLVPFGGGSKMYDINQSIERWQKVSLGRVFAQFLKLGMDSVGTQSLVQGSQDFFTLLLEYLQGYPVEVWNQQLVPYLFAHNPSAFPGMTGYPKIVGGKVGKVDIEGLIKSLDTSTKAKLFTPSDTDEDWVREQIGAPEMQDDLRGMDREVEQAPYPGMYEIKRVEVLNGH